MGLALSPATTAAAAAEAALRQSKSPPAAAAVSAAAAAAAAAVCQLLRIGLGLLGAFVVWMVAGEVATWLLLMFSWAALSLQAAAATACF
jgi:hypothetical protein